MTLHNGTRMGRGRIAVIAAVLVATVGISTVGSVVAAESEDEHQYASDFGLGVGAVFVDLVYMPLKFVYATLGGLTGGLAYVLTAGRSDTATAIWRPSLGGTYVITPAMLRGDEPIHFSGQVDQAEEGRNGDRSSSEESVGNRGHHTGESY
jgi:hypothetical protein